MKKTISLSLLAISALYSAEIELSPIGVEATMITEVAQKAQKSADVAQALDEAVPSIDISRRSGIANDVFIRGQKRDNISVEVDGTKVYGACPNRMDPPISHIVTNQIQDIEVIEGPYDVENFGTLSGGLRITTKAPTKEFKGELNVGAGSFGYKKFGASASGGTDTIKASASLSTESSDQYRDGNGDTLAQQLNKGGAAGNKLRPEYQDMQAYSKQSAMAKLFVTTLKDQELRLEVTANRSTGILYANTPMDAVYDDSNIYSVAYNIDNVSDVYKNINLQYYHSDVDHPMDTQFRMASVMTNPTATPPVTVASYMTNQLQTSVDGFKLKNSFDLSSYELLVGLDGSRRMWQGEKFKTRTDNGVEMMRFVSLPHTETTNQAIFAKLDKSFGALDLSIGARYDYTNIKPTSATREDRDYSALNANILTTYNLNKENKLFLGLGQASRVPDARELYIVKGYNATTKMYSYVGNQELEQTTNQEVDLGYELNNQSFKFKAKLFYSMLKDYIYYNKAGSTFTNIDATIYGGELSASLYATDALSFDMGASYKHGEKDEPLAGQTDTNLADIAPLRGNIAANYEYMANSTATLEVVASDKWSDYDADNGEQELDAWGIVNAKIKHAVNKNFDFTLGVNNLFDETYVQSNTYYDLTFVTSGTETMLLNEPGRYLYTNLDFKF